MRDVRGKHGLRGLARAAAGVAAIVLLSTGCTSGSEASGPSAPAGQKGAGGSAEGKETRPGAKEEGVKKPDVSGQAGSSGSFVILQMNLCNSGKADCYEDGKSIEEGIGRIQKVAPTVTTVNEVCRNDVTRMARETGLRGVFQAAKDSEGGAYKCENGEDYGVGIIGGRPYEQAPETHGGWYGDQDPDTSEQRPYLCATFTGYTACTTHLALNGDVALSQCTGEDWPLKGRADEPIVLGGDLNLKFEGSPNVQDCVPSGFFRKGYTTHLGLVRGVQHVMAADSSFSYSRQEELPMNYTDHPAFAVHLETK